MKLFTRKGLVAVGAALAVSTTGVVAPANAEQVTYVASEDGTTVPRTSSDDGYCKDEEHADEFGCKFKAMDIDDQLGVVTGIAGAISVIIGLLGTIYSFVNRVAGDLA